MCVCVCVGSCRGVSKARIHSGSILLALHTPTYESPPSSPRSTGNQKQQAPFGCRNLFRVCISWWVSTPLDTQFLANSNNAVASAAAAALVDNDTRAAQRERRQNSRTHILGKKAAEQWYTRSSLPATIRSNTSHTYSNNAY